MQRKKAEHNRMNYLNRGQFDSAELFPKAPTRIYGRIGSFIHVWTI